MSLLSQLDSFLKTPDSPKRFEDYRDELLYLYFKHGLSYEDFINSPVPYTLTMVEMYVKEQKREKEAMKGKGKGKGEF